MAIQDAELAVLEALPAEAARELLLRLADVGSSNLGDALALLLGDLGHLDQVDMPPLREWLIRTQLLCGDIRSLIPVTGPGG
jgi:hypothetical protein